MGLRIRPGRDIEIVSFDDEAFVAKASAVYYEARKRHGLSRDIASTEMRRNGTLIGAMKLMDDQADALICGTTGTYASHLWYIEETIGLRPEAHGFAAMNLLHCRGIRCSSATPTSISIRPLRRSPR